MKKWWPLVAVCAGTFMLLVDGSIPILHMAAPLPRGNRQGRSL